MSNEDLPERLFAAAQAIEELSEIIGTTPDCAYPPWSLRKQANLLISRRGKPE